MAYNVVFPQGTKTIFTQEFAPVGWTKVTNFGSMQNVQGAAIRISSGNVSYMDGVPFETVFFNANILGNLSASPTTPGSPTITINSTLGSTTLTEAQMPKHTHLRMPSDGPQPSRLGTSGFGVVQQPAASLPPATGNLSYSEPVIQWAMIYANPYPGTMVPYWDKTNLAIRYSNALTDGMTMWAGSTIPKGAEYWTTPNSGSHNHTMSATLTALPVPINFAIKYVDCVIASKD